MEPPVGHLPARHPRCTPADRARHAPPRHDLETGMHHWTRLVKPRARPPPPTSPRPGLSADHGWPTARGAACHRLASWLFEALADSPQHRRLARTGLQRGLAPGFVAGYSRRHDHGCARSSMTWWPRVPRRTVPRRSGNVMAGFRAGTWGVQPPKGSGRTQSIRCAPQPGSSAGHGVVPALTGPPGAGRVLVSPDRYADPPRKSCSGRGDGPPSARGAAVSGRYSSPWRSSSVVVAMQAVPSASGLSMAGGRCPLSGHDALPR